MKRRSCFRILKTLTLKVNFYLLSLGVVIMSMGLCHKYVCFSTHWYLQILEESRPFFDITLLRVSAAMLGVGAQMILLGILGFYGTWHNSLCILGLSLTFLIVLLLEIITVIMWPPAYHNSIKFATESVVKNDYANNKSSIVDRFDAIQKKLHCCGSEGPLDWSQSDYSIPTGPKNTSTNYSTTRTTNLKQTFELPVSCCRNPTDESCLEYVKSVYEDTINKTIIYTQVIIGVSFISSTYHNTINTFMFP